MRSNGDTDSVQEAARAAIAWLTRQRDPNFADWAGFTAWLESDPANSKAYGRIAALDEAVADDLKRDPPEREGESDKSVGRFRQIGRWAAGLALAATAAGGMFAVFLPKSSSPYEVRTAAGQSRVIVLKDGTRLTLAGATRVQLDHTNPRTAVVEEGDAMFEVVHRSGDPFRVTFQDGSVTDLGTRFTIERRAEETDVAVAEGAVAFESASERMELRPGDRLRVGREGLSLTHISIEDIGSWTRGRLVYDRTPLRRVAADLGRALGVPVSVRPGLADREITAVVQLDRDPASTMRRVGPLLGVSVARRGDGWMLAAAP